MNRKQIKQAFRPFIFGLTLAVVMTGCSRCKDTGSQTSTGTAVTANVNEIVTEDKKVGTGPAAKSGNTVTVHYTGTLTNGTKFDSSLDRGQPFTFSLGAGQVIKGWDVGVAGMQKGGVRILKIPSALAYGERGAGNVIPPNSPLIFEVELLDIK